MKKIAIKVLSSIYPETKPISLMYHTISDIPESIAISKEQFQQHLKYIQKSNLSVIGEKDEITKNSIHLTFDDGYEDNYFTVFPLLEEYNFNATIFITTHFLGKKFKYNLSLMNHDQVRKISQSKLISIGAHTMNHLKLDTLTYNQQEKEIIGSKDFLENLINKEINIFAPPFGRYNHDTIQILKKHGFEKSYTVKKGELSLSDPYEIKRIAVMKGTADSFEYLNKEGYQKYSRMISSVKKYV